MTGTPDPTGARVGVVVMAYGTPATPADVEPYYTHIRRGRPPSAEQLANLQQRYDALGCNGNEIARTPVVDRLAADGISYRRAYNQNTVCMPARCTILTGQYPRTHGVVANGIALPEDAPRRYRDALRPSREQLRPEILRQLQDA